jgi:hypothetical protein
MTLNNLAAFYKSIEKYTEAEPLYQRALAIFEKALGPTHPKVVTCLRNYVQLLRDTQRRAGPWLSDTCQTGASARTHRSGTRTTSEKRAEVVGHRMGHNAG